MKRIIIGAVVIIALLAAVWWVWGNKTEQKATIGAIYLDTQGYYAGVRWGVQQAAQKAHLPISLLETNAQGDVAKESAFIDTLLSRNVNAILLSAVSTTGSVKSIKRAHEAGIPVICYNTCIEEKSLDQYIHAYLVGDPRLFGEKMGQAAAEYFIANNIQRPRIAVINCEAFEVCIQRRLGFESALKAKVPHAQIVANQEGTILDKAITVAEKILIAHPDIDAIMGESGGATLGAVKAIRAQNRVAKTVVFGADMTTDIAHELEKQEVLKTVVDISGKKMGELVFAEAMKVLNKQPSKEKIIAAPIDVYSSTQAAKTWLATHQDGLP